MKKLTFVLSLTFAVFFTACGPASEDAVKLNDKIVKDQKEIIDIQDLFLSAMVDAKDTAVVSESYYKFDSVLSQMMLKYNNMSKFDDKDNFRKAMIEYVSSIKKISENEYYKLLNIYKKDLSEVTKEDREEWEILAEEANSKESKASERFFEAQKTFAKEYQFELKE